MTQLTAPENPTYVTNYYYQQPPPAQIDPAFNRPTYPSNSVHVVESEYLAISELCHDSLVNHVYLYDPKRKNKGCILAG